MALASFPPPPPPPYPQREITAYSLQTVLLGMYTFKDNLYCYKHCVSGPLPGFKREDHPGDVWQEKW